jgi:hypothetical protein
MASLKMVYAEPRPYFESSSIDPLGECTAGFGSPSGHAMFSVMWAFLLHLDGFGHVFSTWISYLIFFLLTLPFAGLVAFSRLYVGVHSLDQIIYGSLIGLFLAFYLHYIVKPTLFTHLQKLMSGKLSQQTAEEGLWVALSFLLIHFLTTTGSFLYDYYYWDMPSDWTGNLCSDLTINKKFHWTSFVDCMIGYVGFTSYLGLYLLRNQGISYNISFTWDGILIRYGLIIAVALPFLAPMFIISSSDNYWLYLLVANFYPWAGMGFVIFYFVPLIYKAVDAPESTSDNYRWLESARPELDLEGPAFVSSLVDVEMK